MATVATTGAYSDLSGTPAPFDPGTLATVATTGAYSDLSGLPTLGSAAAAGTGDFATTAQGALADTSVQPNDSPSFGSVAVTGTVDGRDVAADGTKLDGIAAGAEVNTVDSVNTQTGAVVLDADDISDAATTNKFTTSGDISKLSGIEAGADVTDTAKVTAAGALMDSEVTNLAQVKAFDSSDYATAAQGTLADSALQSGDNLSVLTNDAGYTTGNDTISLSGDLSGSGTTSINAQIASNVVGAGELNVSGDGTSGQLLASDGDGTFSWVDAASGGGGGLEYTTANTNLTAGGQYLLNITSNVTLTLPASPTTGSIIRIVAANGIDDGYTLTVARNGATINSLSEDLSVDTHGVDFILWYNGTTWSLV